MGAQGAGRFGIPNKGFLWSLGSQYPIIPLNTTRNATQHRSRAKGPEPSTEAETPDSKGANSAASYSWLLLLLEYGLVNKLQLLSQEAWGSRGPSLWKI